MKGQVISGEFGKILVRQKSDDEIELGEILVSDCGSRKILLQVYDLLYGSQISQQNLELLSGMQLEEDMKLEFLDGELRNYTLAVLKNLITINDKNVKSSKALPGFFSYVREIEKEDLSFLTMPTSPIYLGKLRSGSKVLDVDISLPGKDVLSHHILVAATTGKGKSNLTSVMLWNTLDKDYCGFLVLDPHDEYYGRNEFGLKDHSQKEMVSYYTSNNPPVGAKTLKINLMQLKPDHFNGVIDLSDPQKQALRAYYKEYGKKWIEAIVMEKLLNVDFHEGTLGVVRRRIISLLDLEFNGQQLFCNGVFDIQAGQTTIHDIVHELEEKKTVIIDTSQFSGAVEILIGSLVASEVLRRNKRHKILGLLEEKPVISIVLEEAPRVLGKEVLEKGQNIFGTIAREGRKFKVGLFAITQLPSLIPREILANMNTKIILGVEMAAERQAIIDSAAQDLSTDNRNIASLDKGEALVTSNFARFATPIKIPLFKEYAKVEEGEKYKNLAYSGIDT